MRWWPESLLVCALLLAGCASAARRPPPPPPPPADIGGRWTGTWAGYGILDTPRDENVTLDLVQIGGGGEGRLTMEGTLAAESVPIAIRDAAMAGVRVVFTVSGDRVRLQHELGAPLFEADLVVRGERMVGQARDTWPYVYFVLVRDRPKIVAVPVAAEPPPRPVPPPPPLPPPPTLVVPHEPIIVEPPPVAAPLPGGVSPFEPQRRIASPPSEFKQIRDLRPIYFDFDSSEIRAGDAAVLDANAEWLRVHPDQLVLIVGHCDDRGTPEYNVALGERRARATMFYLIDRGIATSRMTVSSYGLESPECAERTEACWARNRRVVLLTKPR